MLIFSDLLLFLALLGVLGGWLALSRAHDAAVSAARRLCERHGVQLLDDSVGLRSLRWRQVNGRRWLEYGYEFELSVDGKDRRSGKLWMVGHHLSGHRLPLNVDGANATSRDNVVLLSARRGK